MGLDNIPHVYPCHAAGTAVLITDDDDRIDCEATITADGCPWSRAVAASDVGKPVYGMLGTYCWYRGKVGEMFRTEVEALVGEDAPVSFYGDADAAEDGGADLSPASARALSDWLFTHAEAYAVHVGTTAPTEAAETFDQYRYAVWWLRWVAEYGEGANAWY